MANSHKKNLPMDLVYNINYDKDGDVVIRRRKRDDIEEKNLSKLTAGVGQKRFTQLLRDKGLSNIIYAYGYTNKRADKLIKKELEFLKSKKLIFIKL